MSTRPLSLEILALAVLLPALALAARSSQDPPAPAAPAEAREEPLPAGVAARIDDLEVSLDEYKDYLLRVYGRRPLADLISLRLLQREAERLGIVITEEELDQAYEELLALWLERRFGGNVEALERELDQMGHDRDSYRLVFRESKRRELLAQRICLATRVITDEAVVERFRRDYGADGITTRVRQVFLTRLKMRQILEARGEPASELTIPRLDAELKELANSVVTRAAAGEDFASLARELSHDLAASSTGGLLEAETWRRYGPTLITAVEASEPGAVVGPITTGAGVHVVEIVSRERTELADVRGTIVEALKGEQASWAEISALDQRLRAAARIRTY